MRAKMKRRPGPVSRASQKRRSVEVVAHLQRRPSQQTAALHADELHPLDALSGTEAGGRVLLGRVVLHVTPVDDADAVPRLLVARPELAAHLGVRGGARGDRRRRDPDRPGGREYLGVTDGTAQIPHPEDLLSGRVALYRRVDRARHGDVPRRRRYRATQMRLARQIELLARTLHGRRPADLRLRQLGGIGHRVTVARVLVAADSLVVVDAGADAVAGIYARR